MTLRTVRLWAVLGGLAALVVATSVGTRLAEVGAGLLLIALALLLVRLDGLRKRGRSRR